MKWAIRHRTSYRFASPVRESFNEIRLKPVNNNEQRLEDYRISATPAARASHYTDFYANWVDLLDVPESHSSLDIETESVVSTLPRQFLSDAAIGVPLNGMREAVRGERCFDYLQASRFVDVSPETWRLAIDATQGQTDAWRAALAIMRFVNRKMSYESDTTHVHTHMRDALSQQRGVCQDFAHVMIGLCRTIHIPALYVSGYLATQNASATHAWMEVYIPNLGWRGLDPTHNCQPGETYVKIAVGRDYNDVPPLRGTYRGTQMRTMEVQVQISSAR